MKNDNTETKSIFTS